VVWLENVIIIPVRPLNLVIKDMKMPIRKQMRSRHLVSSSSPALLLLKTIASAISFDIAIVEYLES